MEIRTIHSDLAVSPQISVEDVAKIAEAGYRSIICNRPDGETDDQIPFAEIEIKAKELGLPFVYQPVISGQVLDSDAADFRKISEDLPKPIFAYCRTGTRCTMLWSLAEAGQQPLEAIISQAAAAGYDLSKMAPRIEGLAKDSAA